MKHGTLTKKGEQVELRFERRLAHPPAKVWRALTDNAELSHVGGRRAAVGAEARGSGLPAGLHHPSG